MALGADAGPGAGPWHPRDGDVAILWDWESFWAQDLEWRPSVDLDHRERVVAFYTRLWRDDITVDFVHPHGDLSKYRLVIAPQLYLIDQAGVDNLRSFVNTGGQLLVSYFSGVVDTHDHVHPQGLSGPLGELLGISVQEFAPLAQDQRVAMDMSGQRLSGDVWTDRLAITDDATRVVGRFVDGPAAAKAALTARSIGRGSAWYLATRLDVETLDAVMQPLYAAAGLERTTRLPAGLEIVNRRDAISTFQFLINHTDRRVDVPTAGTDVVTGVHHRHEVSVPPGGVVVIEQPH